jgi:hypothetical protein
VEDASTRLTTAILHSRLIVISPSLLSYFLRRSFSTQTA